MDAYVDASKASTSKQFCGWKNNFIKCDTCRRVHHELTLSGCKHSTSNWMICVFWAFVVAFKDWDKWSNCWSHVKELLILFRRFLSNLMAVLTADSSMHASNAFFVTNENVGITGMSMKRSELKIVEKFSIDSWEPNLEPLFLPDLNQSPQWMHYNWPNCRQNWR